MYLHQGMNGNVCLYTFVFDILYKHTWAQQFEFCRFTRKLMMSKACYSVCTTNMYVQNFIIMFASLLPYRSRRLEQLLKLLPIWLVLHSSTYSLSLQNFLSHTLFHIQTRTKTEDNPLSNSLQYKSVSHIYICPFWYTNSGWPSPHMTSCLQMPSHMDSLSFPLTQHCTMHIYLTLHLTYSLPPQ